MSDTAERRGRTRKVATQLPLLCSEGLACSHHTLCEPRAKQSEAKCVCNSRAEQPNVDRGSLRHVRPRQGIEGARQHSLPAAPATLLSIW
eukprot:3830807-Rhodomonas_salina.2